jgi:LPS-assembly protein
MRLLSSLCLLAVLSAGAAVAQTPAEPAPASPLPDPGLPPLTEPSPAPVLPDPGLPPMEVEKPPVLPKLPEPPLPQGTLPTPPPDDKWEALRQKLDAIGNLRIDATDIRLAKDGKITLQPRSGVLHFEADGMEVFAGSAEYISETEDLRFMGDVAMYRDGVIYRGESAVYNLSSRQIDASGMRSSYEPLFFKAAGIRSTANSEMSEVSLDAPEFTTDDSTDPAYRITADRVELYPNDRVVFHKFRIKAGDTTLFYLPKVSQQLDGELAYSVLPGYRSNLGAYVLNRYNTTIGDHSTINYQFDLYSRRGAGFGFDLNNRKYGRDSRFGKFKFYWLYDSDPTISNTFSTASRADVDESRYRVNLQHRVYLPAKNEGDFYVDVDLNVVSDEFFYEDFFQSDFRDNPQPDNLVNIVKRGDRGEISLYGRFRVNDDYQTDTRLPELAIDRAIQPLWNSGIYFAGSSSFGRLEEHLGDDDEDRIQSALSALGPRTAANAAEYDALTAALIEPAYTRSHTWGQFYYPITFHEAITIIPHIGAGFTSYSSIDGPRPLDDSRFIFSAGLDASVKFSRVYDDVVIPSLGLDGLRHIVQPYVNWSYVSTDDLGGGFIGIDRLVPSTRPRPLSVSQFSAIDSLRDWNIIRLGVANRLQTRRNGATYSWLTANTYIDAFIEDPEYDRDFSNLYQDIEWRPVPWVKLNLGAQVPIGGDDANFSEFNARATFMPTDSLEFSIGPRILRSHPVFQDSSLIDFGAYARINENWGFSVYERYEMEDSTFETQQYTIHRDLTNWIASLGAIVRDHRGQDEWGVLLSLTLKDFPAVRVPVDFDPSGGRE